MERTKLFVSYSHQDRDWLAVLRRHLAILERKKLVHLWSDEKIRTGDYWENEIEKALGESAIAVLLVTADFLGSSYIWDKEMPRIWNHMAVGMHVLPIIARPCAWELEPQLSRLQVAPEDGRPLSSGTPDDIDKNLTRLTYELAHYMPDVPVLAKIEPVESDDENTMVGHWTGKYGQHTALALDITEQTKRTFSGSMTYSDTGTVTAVSGEVLPGPEPRVIFREDAYIRAGSRQVELEGEYTGVLGSNKIEGRWKGAGGLSDNFSLERTKA